MHSNLEDLWRYETIGIKEPGEQKSVVSSSLNRFNVQFLKKDNINDLKNKFSTRFATFETNCDKFPARTTVRIFIA